MIPSHAAFIRMKTSSYELVSLFEGMEPLVKFCYTLEGDGELAVEAGYIIDGMYELYPARDLPDMVSVNRLIAVQLISFKIIKNISAL